MKQLLKDKLFISLCIFILLGILIGFILFFNLDVDSKVTLKKSIIETVSFIKEGSINIEDGLINSIIKNVLIVSVVLVSSIILIGIPIPVIYLIYKGINISMCLSSFIYAFGLKGIINSLIFSFPYELINIITIFSLSFIGLKLSFKLIDCIKNNLSINIKRLYKKIFLIYASSLIIALISSLLEVYLNTFLIKTLF